MRLNAWGARSQNALGFERQEAWESVTEAWESVKEAWDSVKEVWESVKKASSHPTQ